MSLAELLREREEKQNRLNWLGIRSDKSELLEKRIKEIDTEIERMQKSAS